MLDTNDIFNDAVRDSTLHGDERSAHSITGSKVVAVLLLASIAVVGFNFYTSKNTIDNSLVVKHELVAQNESIKEPVLVQKHEIVASNKTHKSDSEKAYLNALRGIESELSEERESLNLNTQVQSDLSSSMNNIIEDALLSDTSTYTHKLKKELGDKLEKPVEIASKITDKSIKKDNHTVVVKKGDTLQGLSDKFYGDAMDYKRIIASNDSLNNSDTIYEGQTIILPY